MLSLLKSKPSAWDSAMQTQPALPDETWNFKGYLSAVWHRVPVSVA